MISAVRGTVPVWDTPSNVIVPVASAYLPNPPTIVRSTCEVKSPGSPGTGVRGAETPVAINTSPAVVRKTSYDVTLGGGVVRNTVLAPLSTPVTVPSSLPIGSFEGIAVSAMPPRMYLQSARASMAVPSITTHNASVVFVFLVMTNLLCVIRTCKVPGHVMDGTRLRNPGAPSGRGIPPSCSIKAYAPGGK